MKTESFSLPNAGAVGVARRAASGFGVASAGTADGILPLHF
jgi:hypothetical protein